MTDIRVSFQFRIMRLNAATLKIVTRNLQLGSSPINSTLKKFTGNVKKYLISSTA